MVCYAGRMGPFIWGNGKMIYIINKAVTYIQMGRDMKAKLLRV